MKNTKALISKSSQDKKSIYFLVTEKNYTSSQDQQPDDTERSREPPLDENSLVAMDTSEALLSEREDRLRRKDRRVLSRGANGNSSINLSKMDVDHLLDEENMKTMDGCLKILAQLHVSEALEESE